MTTSNPLQPQMTPLSPNGFQFAIQKLPEVTYFCQDVNLPGITLGTPDFGNPFSTIPIPGDHLTYDVLNLQFQIDETMSNYKAIYNWIIALGFPQDYQQYIKLLDSAAIASLSELAKNSSDGTLIILDHMNNPAQTVKFHDMFPITLETIGFATTNTDVPYIVGSATFKFSYFEFV